MSPILELRDVHVRFGALNAVCGVDLEVQRGRTLGIVGESGCGKSTLARVMVGLQDPSQGSVLLDHEAVSRQRTVAQRREVQMIFQDPSSSLNPRMKVGSMLQELVRSLGPASTQAVRARMRELVELVGLPDQVLGARPPALSGGQRQRVAIARALAVEPQVLVADEAVAALDVSVQATIINLFLDLQSRLDLTLVFISHDLGVVRSLCDDVAVMYLGRIVERCTAEALFERPSHPYSEALLAAAPRIEPATHRRTAVVRGELPSPYDVPSGCRFHPRCAKALASCATHDPPLLPVADGRSVACVLPVVPLS